MADHPTKEARKAFLLRIDPKVLESLQRWADDDLRSLNGQIEYVLRKTLKDEGRLKDEPPSASKRNEKG